MKPKKLFFAIAFLSITTVFAQKTDNGKIYIEHPAIGVVDQFVKATVSGKEAAISGFLTDDFKAYNGIGNKPDDQGLNKKAFIQNALLYQDKLDYYAVETFPGAYPDAMEYKKDNKDGDIVIQNWYKVNGVHKETGVKIDAAAFRMYYLNKDNKIKRIINYSNTDVINEIGLSSVNRTNGKLYDHHDNINTVRKAMYAFEKGDIDKSLSYYTENVQFRDINDTADAPAKTKAEIKILWQDFLKKFEIESIEMIGYPDYLEYERGNGHTVISWWKYHLIRKSDKKKIKLYYHFSNDFDDTGKITSEMEYYGANLLKN